MAYMRHMVDMELDDEEKLELAKPELAPKPDYPYGLRICLTEKEFERLDLDPSVAEVGGMVHGHFMGQITSVSQNESNGDPCTRVEIQIKMLEIESESEEDEEAE